MAVKRYSRIAAFILAGGASSRMGQNKCLLEFCGVPLIVRTARLLEPLIREVTVIGPPHRYVAMGLDAIDDVGEQAGRGAKKIRRGPLAGIATALAATRSPWNLIVACDLPYLSEKWLDWLLSRTVRTRAQVILPQTERGLEPLAAVYRRECGPAIDAALARGSRKVIEVIEEFRVDIVEQREWRGHDPSGRVLTNMNTPAEYEQARKWLER